MALGSNGPMLAPRHACRCNYHLEEGMIYAPDTLVQDKYIQPCIKHKVRADASPTISIPQNIIKFMFD